MVPEPTMKLISWTAMRTTEAIVDRVTDRITANAKVRLVAKVRHHVPAGSAGR